MNELIIQDKLKEAAQWIAEKNPALSNECILLKSRIALLERDKNAGISDPRDDEMERNKIIAALQSLAKKCA